MFALCEKLGARIYYAVADAPFMTRGTAKRGIRSWLSDRLPKEGLLVLLKGLLEEAPPLRRIMLRMVNESKARSSRLPLQAILRDTSLTSMCQVVLFSAATLSSL
jgi:hypothetical protein